jgi:hypothetical protein
VANLAASRKRVEVTVETDQVLVIRKRRPVRWCQQCGREVEVVSRQQDGDLAGELALPRNVESEACHVWTDEHGKEVVCLPSLLKSMGNVGEIQRKISGS